jgi:hypothetical protein
VRPLFHDYDSIRNTADESANRLGNFMEDVVANVTPHTFRLWLDDVDSKLARTKPQVLDALTRHYGTLKALQSNTEALAADPNAPPGLSATIYWGVNDEIVFLDRYKEDQEHREQDKDHSSICKPKAEFGDPVTWVRVALSEAAQIINTGSFFDTLWWPAYRRAHIARGESVVRAAAYAALLEQTLWLAIGVETGYFEPETVAHAPLDPEQDLFQPLDDFATQWSGVLPDLALDRLRQVRDGGISNRCTFRRAVLEVSGDAQRTFRSAHLQARRLMLGNHEARGLVDAVMFAVPDEWEALMLSRYSDGEFDTHQRDAQAVAMRAGFQVFPQP